MTWKLSAYADELGPDPAMQFDVLAKNGIPEVQLRGAWGLNVMDLSPSQLRQLKRLADGAGLGFHGIGSPLGKVAIDTPEQESLEGVSVAAAAAHMVGCDRVRVFSFYRDASATAESIRGRVIDRLAKMCEVAEREGVKLFHENEKDIYGDTGARCVDLLKSVPALGCCFDFANFVQVGESVYEDCWLPLRNRVDYFDVKDAVRANGEVKPAGHGDADVERILRDALSRGFSGRFNLEPHLSGGGQFGGETTPELFEVAVKALRDVLEQASG